MEGVISVVLAVSCSSWTRRMGRWKRVFRVLVVSSLGWTLIFPFTASGSTVSAVIHQNKICDNWKQGKRRVR